MAPIRIGTRGSTLALAQATLVGEALAAHGVNHETVVIETAGDRRAPDTAWGEGAFVTEIESALVDGRIDMAVHSAKDLPIDEDPRTRVGAFLTRAEPRDALVVPAGSGWTLSTLPAGTVVGTDSPRRTGFLRAHRPDLDVRPLSGNVDTRLRKLDDGVVGALLLAAAGLMRLGRADRISELVPVSVVPPAPGQGAIAVQVRRADELAAAITAQIDDGPTRQAVEAERSFLHATGGGCRAPIGALATVHADTIELTGGFATIDGRSLGLHSISGPVADRLALAEQLAQDLVERRARVPGMQRVLVTRGVTESRRLSGRLAEFGIAGVIVPAIDVEILDRTSELDSAVHTLHGFDWIVVTSANGARAVCGAAARLDVDPAQARWAAVGHATARELLAHGAQRIWLPSAANAAALAREIPIEPGDTVLWAHGDLVDDAFAQTLRARGATVTAVTVYRTLVAPTGSRPALRAALAEGPVAALIFASPSAVNGLLELIDEASRATLLAIPAVVVGPTTAAAARAAGFVVITEARTQEASALAEQTAEAISGTHSTVSAKRAS